MLRGTQLEQLETQQHDVLIVGGGINGAVSALTLSAMGFRVAIIDKGDFGSFTSQESSSLAWGGIKYLESYEVGLVWNLCRSRNELMAAFPSQVREIRFLTTLVKGFRKPRLLMYLGTWLYWIMGRFFTARPKLLSRKEIGRSEPVINLADSVGGVEYSDAYFVDTDARFVFNLVRKALDFGATAVNYVEATDFCRDQEGCWQVRATDHRQGRQVKIKANLIVNATGPFADQINQQLGNITRHKHVFSKGVHLLVPQITHVRRILTFFADDGRMFFVIPMGQRSCIGTTDTPVDRLPPEVTDADRDFILENINKRLKLERPLTRADILAERCGVRPLVVAAEDSQQADDWLNLSRKHEVEASEQKGVISIFGGKLTDCLNVGREVTEHVQKCLGRECESPKNLQWLAEPSDMRPQFDYEAGFLGLGREHRERLWRRFQHRAFAVLDLYREDLSMRDLLLGDGLISKGELVHMARHELVTNLDDFLRRRTALALEYSAQQLVEMGDLRQVCELLFGAEAESIYRGFIGPKSAHTERPKAVSALDSDSR